MIRNYLLEKKSTKIIIKKVLKEKDRKNYY